MKLLLLRSPLASLLLGAACLLGAYSAQATTRFVNDDWVGLSAGQTVSVGQSLHIGVDAFATIQQAIDASAAGDTISVLPGSYIEHADDRNPVPGGSDSEDYGLFIATTGLTVQGVDQTGTPLTSAASALLPVVTFSQGSTSGVSGILVVADGVTITGLNLTPYSNTTLKSISPTYTPLRASRVVPTEADARVTLAATTHPNKTIEVWGDGTRIAYCLINALDATAIYLNDALGDPAATEAHLRRFTIEGNTIETGSIDLAGGAGRGDLLAQRLIRNNTIRNNGAVQAISFNGKTAGIAWFDAVVGGAVISGNTFTNNAIQILARGDCTTAQMDWKSWFENNTFDRSVVAGTQVPDTPREGTYTAGGVSFSHWRQIGAPIQEEVSNTAKAGDSLLVGPGTYQEQVVFNKTLTVEGPNAGRPGYATRHTEAIITPPTLTVPAVVLAASNLLFDGFKVIGPTTGTLPAAITLGDGYAGRNLGSSMINISVLNNLIQVPPTTKAAGILCNFRKTNDSIVVRQNLVTGSFAYGMVFLFNSTDVNVPHSILVDENEVIWTAAASAKRGTTLEAATLDAPGIVLGGSLRSTIRANRLVNNPGNGVRVGAAVSPFSEIIVSGAPAATVVTSNLFQANGTDLKVMANAASTLKVTYNAFDSEGVAIQNDDATPINACANFWGTSGSPASGCLVGSVTADSPLTDVRPIFDHDGDGLLDGEEDINGNGVTDATETDPFNPDTDGDGFTDGVEVAAGLSPLIFNTIADADLDGLPATVDPDDQDPDYDHDGFTDGFELGHGYDPQRAVDRPLLGDADGNGDQQVADCETMLKTFLGQLSLLDSSLRTEWMDVSRDGAYGPEDAGLLYNWLEGSVPWLPVLTTSPQFASGNARIGFSYFNYPASMNLVLVRVTVLRNPTGAAPVQAAIRLIYRPTQLELLSLIEDQLGPIAPVTRSVALTGDDAGKQAQDIITYGDYTSTQLTPGCFLVAFRTLAGAFNPTMLTLADIPAAENCRTLTLVDGASLTDIPHEFTSAQNAATSWTCYE